MADRSKRFQEAQALVTEDSYSPEDACALVKETATANFDESVEMHLRLGVDSRHADQQVRGTVVLPNGTGQEITVLVFAEGDATEAAKAAGADYVGSEDLAEKIQEENWLDFDVAVATPDMMKYVGRLGRILGPKGLMPNPKAGTVTTDVETAVKELKAGKVEYRLDKTNLMHVVIGKASFSAEELLENYNALLDAVIADRPAGVKGQYIKSISVSASMGPGINVNH